MSPTLNQKTDKCGAGGEKCGTRQDEDLVWRERMRVPCPPEHRVGQQLTVRASSRPAVRFAGSPERLALRETNGARGFQPSGRSELRRRSFTRAIPAGLRPRGGVT